MVTARFPEMNNEIKTKLYVLGPKLKFGELRFREEEQVFKNTLEKTVLEIAPSDLMGKKASVTHRLKWT